LIQVAETKIDPRKLLVRPRRQAPSLWQEPLGWISFQQRAFTEKMRATLRDIRKGSAATAAWTLILLSFAYGIFHAAGPGHGKAVVSAWLLANERQLRRGVLIAFMAAIVQALTAIVLVTVLLYAVKAVGSTARAFAGYLEAASFGLIALLGLYLIWQALTWLRATPQVAIAGHGHDAHHTHHDHHHTGDDCACGHAHMPGARDVDDNWSLARAFSLSFAVGIRPCSGAILALLASSALGIYWAGIVSTFAMAIGVAITVSLIAMLAVSARKVAFHVAGGNTRWLDRTAFGLRLAGGLFIAILGTVLFLNALNNPISFS
jgi:ABC-type nickel/cobalt efflux system permease component RcnA